MLKQTLIAIVVTTSLATALACGGLLAGSTASTVDASATDASAIANDASDLFGAPADAESDASPSLCPGDANCTLGRGQVTLASSENEPRALATDDAFVYWTTPDAGGSLRRVAVTGGSVATLATGIGAPNKIIADSQYVYWSGVNSANTVIFRVAAAGGKPSIFYNVPHWLPSAEMQSSFVEDLAIDANNLYYSGYSTYQNVDGVDPGASGGIAKVSLTSGTGSTVLAASGTFASVALDSANVYAVNTTKNSALNQTYYTILYAPLDGSSPGQVGIGDCFGTAMLASDGLGLIFDCFTGSSLGVERNTLTSGSVDYGPSGGSWDAVAADSSGAYLIHADDNTLLFWGRGMPVVTVVSGQGKLANLALGRRDIFWSTTSIADRTQGVIGRTAK